MASDAPRCDLRPAVLWFGQQMEAALRRHDDRPGWADADAEWLLSRLRQETYELEVALLHHHAMSNQASEQVNNRMSNRIISEAADVANFCMMLADNARGVTGGPYDGE
jgi:NTP pyrophosphatase (non-canonical NTP hydrolase)